MGTDQLLRLGEADLKLYKAMSPPRSISEGPSRSSGELLDTGQPNVERLAGSGGTIVGRSLRRRSSHSL